MTNSQIHPQGWISLLIAPANEERAKQMRADLISAYPVSPAINSGRAEGPECIELVALD